MPHDLERAQVGVTGEYAVAAELSIRGYLAAITLRNSRGIDIVASSADASKSVTIQVKTSKGGGPKWQLSKKAESYYADGHYYVFVLLNDVGERPGFYVVPSEVVAEYVSMSHKRWLAGTKKDGSPRKDSNLRTFRDSEGLYKERWDILHL